MFALQGFRSYIWTKIWSFSFHLNCCSKNLEHWKDNCTEFVVLKRNHHAKWKWKICRFLKMFSFKIVLKSAALNVMPVCHLSCKNRCCKKHQKGWQEEGWFLSDGVCSVQGNETVLLFIFFWPHITIGLETFERVKLSQKKSLLI